MTSRTKQRRDMDAKYHKELIDRFLNKTVKHSGYALRSLWDAYCNAGRHAQKMGYRRQYDAKAAERGTVIAVTLPDHDRGVAFGLHVKWDKGYESKCLPYMVEVV